MLHKHRAPQKSMFVYTEGGGDQNFCLRSLCSAKATKYPFAVVDPKSSIKELLIKKFCQIKMYSNVTTHCIFYERQTLFIQSKVSSFRRNTSTAKTVNKT